MRGRSVRVLEGLSCSLAGIDSIEGRHSAVDNEITRRPMHSTGGREGSLSDRMTANNRLREESDSVATPPAFIRHSTNVVCKVRKILSDL